MANRLLNEAHLRRIRVRQCEDRWGPDYVASVWATPQEAPGWKCASILVPRKLGSRDFHTFGRPDRFVALLALHNDRLWDLHEQRILFPEPREHFLFGHPSATGMKLNPLLGTIDVASRMGILSKHPRIYVRTSDAARTAMVVPFPFIGDLLLYLEDEAGVYVLNWSVTDRLKDFRPRGRPRVRVECSHDRDLSERDSKLIENIYYQDADIRTQKVAGELVDFDLRCNLCELFLAQNRVVGLPQEMISEIRAMFQAGVGSCVVGYEVVREVAVKFGIKDDVALVILKQGVWNREIRVDLFRPFLIDKPLHPEVCDVFERYRDWFRR